MATELLRGQQEANLRKLRTRILTESNNYGYFMGVIWALHQLGRISTEGRDICFGVCWEKEHGIQRVKHGTKDGPALHNNKDLVDITDCRIRN